MFDRLLQFHFGVSHHYELDGSCSFPLCANHFPDGKGLASITIVKIGRFSFAWLPPYQHRLACSRYGRELCYPSAQPESLTS